MLKFQLTELAKSEFDLQLTGFDSIESVNFLSGLEVPSSAPEAADTEADERPDDRELKPSEMKLYREAWRRVMSDWDDLTKAWEERRYFSANFTKGSLAVYFVRSLFFGDNIPRGATTPYTGHRFFVAGEKYAIAAAFRLAIRDNSLLDSMIWLYGGRPTFDKMFQSLAIHGHRAPADFPAILARSLIEEFTKSGAHILDPCHGWGGRMLGFLLSKTAAHYHGFEVDPKTRDGVQEIFNDLKSLAPRAKSCNLVLRPFEESKLKPSSYDFALTSPPYFDVEKYNGDKSSWRRYPKFDAWVDGFYRPLIEKTAAALKTRAIFALQVGNQSYPLEDKAKEIAGTCGLRFVEKRSTNMRNNYTETAAEEGEIVLIFEKASASSSPRKDKKDVAEKYGSIL